MVGNLDVDLEQQQRIGHLLSPLPPEMRDDTAFMDPSARLRARLGLSQAHTERAFDGPFRSGQRRSQRVLDPLAQRQPGLRDAGQNPLG